MSRTDNKELIERYVYDVTKRLPEKMRQDIGEELRTLIEDMAEEQKIEDVLMELGDPAKLARKYRGEKGSLISGEYYDMYWFIMKIVLICTAAGLIISDIIEGVVQTVNTGYDISAVYNYYAEVGFSVFSIGDILLKIFGAVTITFIILEKYKVNVKQDELEWNIGKLPEIPAKESVIKKGSMIAEIVFSVLVTVLYVTVPHWLGVWSVNSNENSTVIQTIPIFNMTIWSQVLPLLLTITLLGIINSIVKLVQGCYTIPIMITTAVSNVVSFIICVIVFKGYPIWNPDFATGIEEFFHITFESTGDIMTYWNTHLISNVVLAVMAFCFVLDTGSVVYRTLKNRK